MSVVLQNEHEIIESKGVIELFKDRLQHANWCDCDLVVLPDRKRAFVLKLKVKNYLTV